MTKAALQHCFATRDDIPVLTALVEAPIVELQKPFLDEAQIRASRALMGSTPSSSTVGVRLPGCCRRALSL